MGLLGLGAAYFLFEGIQLQLRVEKQEPVVTDSLFPSDFVTFGEFRAPVKCLFSEIR